MVKVMVSVFLVALFSSALMADEAQQVTIPGYVIPGSLPQKEEPASRASTYPPLKPMQQAPSTQAPLRQRPLQPPRSPMEKPLVPAQPQQSPTLQPPQSAAPVQSFPLGPIKQPAS